jgi:chromosome segregation ATPase
VSIRIPVSLKNRYSDLREKIVQLLSKENTTSENPEAVEKLLVDLSNKKLKIKGKILQVQNQLEILNIQYAQLEDQFEKLNVRKTNLLDSIKTEKAYHEKLRGLFCYVNNVLSRKSFCSVLDIEREVPETLQNNEYVQLLKLFSEEDKSYSFELFSNEADPLFFVKTGIRKEVI